LQLYICSSGWSYDTGFGQFYPIKLGLNGMFYLAILTNKVIELG
jgi:hypothetical protein